MGQPPFISPKNLGSAASTFFGLPGRPSKYRPAVHLQLRGTALNTKIGKNLSSISIYVLAAARWRSMYQIRQMNSAITNSVLIL